LIFWGKKLISNEKESFKDKNMDDQNTTVPVQGAIPAPAPELINGVKIYPTSYIHSSSVLHTPKKMLTFMELEHIEVIHVICFISITIFLFIGMWKRANLR
jgi:hypothetical protein